MDRQRFFEARDAVLHERPAGKGIGTLSEKTLHAVLKRYFEPDRDSQEIKVGRYVADIVGEDGIIEIQTQSFHRLRAKLDAFLSCTRVTVVYPIARSKGLCWIDPQTDTVTKRRKSPKTGSVYDAFSELYQIKQQLTHPNLRICLVLMEWTEYRFLDGWSRDKKKGASRCERIPDEIFEEIRLDCPADYLKLIPGGLPPAFTSKTYAKAAGTPLHAAQTALNVLHSVEAVRRVGKQGNTYLYERCGCEGGMAFDPAPEV